MFNNESRTYRDSCVTYSELRDLSFATSVFCLCSLTSDRVSRMICFGAAAGHAAMSWRERLSSSGHREVELQEPGGIVIGKTPHFLQARLV